MPPITNALAVQFCDQRVRVLAAAFITAYDSAKKFVDEWNALSMATLVPSTADEVDDHSDVDGRPRLTGSKVNDMLAMSQGIVTAFEAGAPSRISRLRAIDMTGSSRF